MLGCRKQPYEVFYRIRLDVSLLQRIRCTLGRSQEISPMIFLFEHGSHGPAQNFSCCRAYCETRSLENGYMYSEPAKARMGTGTVPPDHGNASTASLADHFPTQYFGGRITCAATASPNRSVGPALLSGVLRCPISSFTARSRCV